MFFRCTTLRQNSRDCQCTATEIMEVDVGHPIQGVSTVKIKNIHGIKTTSCKIRYSKIKTVEVVPQFHTLYFTPSSRRIVINYRHI